MVNREGLCLSILIVLLAAFLFGGIEVPIHIQCDNVGDIYTQTRMLGKLSGSLVTQGNAIILRENGGYELLYGQPIAEWDKEICRTVNWNEQ